MTYICSLPEWMLPASMHLNKFRKCIDCMMVKIFLIGMMGSGKSYWKQELAKHFKTGGYDLDFYHRNQ